MLLEMDINLKKENLSILIASLNLGALSTYEFQESNTTFIAKAHTSTNTKELIKITDTLRSKDIKFIVDEKYNIRILNID